MQLALRRPLSPSLWGRASELNDVSNFSVLPQVSYSEADPYVISQAQVLVPKRRMGLATDTLY